MLFGQRMSLAAAALQCVLHVVQPCTTLCTTRTAVQSASGVFRMHVWRCVQAFDGADIIVHELGNSISIADLLEQPAAVQDDRLVASRFGNVQ